MRRTFDLQMVSKPKGRVFTCDTCDHAGFHPVDAPPSICPNCSPFLAVYAYADRLVAVCKWVKESIFLDDEAEATAWYRSSDDIPYGVLTALLQHFRTQLPTRVELIPPNVVVPMPPAAKAQVGSVVKILANQDITSGDMLLNEHQTPIGVAQHDAMTGQMVDVKLNSIGALLAYKDGNTGNTLTQRQATMNKFIDDLDMKKNKQYE